ncbi:rhodanese-like domain-containing protein [Paenibacillus lycopersici]|uniref:Rhodanese-like domain-containing protein n=1 Tax=Paenibacillus lycopersici TaxID=2704462 RepID=A0A6C0G7F5_9BACL|nr:rhodanese-like domain-containing protein [Paenibacillus lycopersici]QHT63665.1 rhodanese-like domain-containing protein [Paenibacillus lycopersici]
MNTAIDVLFVLIIIWFGYSRFGPARGLRTLKAADFRRAAEDTAASLLIDVREPAEYRSGRIAGALNVPLSQLGRRMNELPQDRDILLYCRSGMRSKQAARMLRKRGFTRLSQLQGGIGAWSEPLDKPGF